MAQPAEALGTEETRPSNAERFDALDKQLRKLMLQARSIPDEHEQSLALDVIESGTDDLSYHLGHHTVERVIRSQVAEHNANPDSDLNNRVADEMERVYRIHGRHSETGQVLAANIQPQMMEGMVKAMVAEYYDHHDFQP